MKKKSILFIFGFFALFSLTACAGLAQDKAKFAVLIGGSGWSEEYSAKYKKFLLETQSAFIENFGFSETKIFVLAESISAGDNRFSGDSRAESIRSLFKSLAESVTPDDDLFVILYGHGSYDGRNGKFNIPGRDMTDADFAALLSEIDANRLLFVNTTQASFPFVQALSNQKRIVITATKSGTQKTETVFPAYFVKALRDPASDLDRNGDLSVLEIFSYASEMTKRFFEENNHLATEHPQLEDTGDGRSFRLSELEKNAEGNLASITFLKRRRNALAETLSGTSGSSLMSRIRQLELDIAVLKNMKRETSEREYYDRLEILLIQLALLNEEIEIGKK